MSVVKYDRSDRGKKYGVKYGHWKKRKFKFFETKAERDDFFSLMQRKEKRDGETALLLSAMEAQVMRKCIDLLGSAESVLAACEVQAVQTSVNRILLTDAITKYIDEKINLGLTDKHVKGSRLILDRFAVAFPGAYTSAITADQAREWTLSLRRAPKTISNYLKVMKSFFNWCETQGYHFMSPFKHVPDPVVIMPEPEFLSVAQAEELFEVANELYPDALAYLALSAFARLRSSACARFDPSSIDFEQKGILIWGEHAKNKRRIFVDGHPDNLWTWLEYAKTHAPEGFEMSDALWNTSFGRTQPTGITSLPVA